MSNCLKTREKSVYKSVRYKLDIRNATRTLDRLPTAYRSIQIDPKSTKSTNCLSSTKVKNRNPRTWAQEFQQIRHIVRHARHFTTLVRRIYAFPVADIERQSIWKLLAPIERRMIVKFVSSTAHGALIQQHAKSGSYSFSLTRSLSLSHSLTSLPVRLLPLLLMVVVMVVSLCLYLRVFDTMKSRIIGWTYCIQNLIWNSLKFIKNYRWQ